MPQRPECALSVGDIAVAIDLSRGARASSLRFRGHELLHHRGDDPVENGMYPMGPWAGRVRDNCVTLGERMWRFPVSYDHWALHGLLLAARAEPVEIVRRPDEQWLRAVVLVAAPMRLRAIIGWTIRSGEVSTSVSIEPLSEPIPVVTGWHPWFRRQLDVGGRLKWSLDAQDMVERGADHLPTGRMLPFDPAAGPFDDAFWVPAQQAMVRWPGFASIEIGNDSPWFVVYDEVPDCVCVEPQSGPPNGVNDGLGSVIAVARPGEPVVNVTRWTFHAEQAGPVERSRWWRRIGSRRP